MFRLDSDKPVEFCDGLRRRDFLRAAPSCWAWDSTIFSP